MSRAHHGFRLVDGGRTKSLLTSSFRRPSKGQFARVTPSSRPESPGADSARFDRFQGLDSLLHLHLCKILHRTTMLIANSVNAKSNASRAKNF
jgi:hypothetical protein